MSKPETSSSHRNISAFALFHEAPKAHQAWDEKTMGRLSDFEITRYENNGKVWYDAAKYSKKPHKVGQTVLEKSRDNFLSHECTELCAWDESLDDKEWFPL